ncbi:MAG TPA: DUF3443 family protein [Myxococcales bacterium]|nr:DUF3443 family protein [Myxococcales bacterium]
MKRLSALLLAVACGGTSTPGQVTNPAGTNLLPVTVDQGPAALAAANEVSANVLYASVTVCTPGSTSACQTIDHIQVDTGSSGLRIVSSVLSGAAVPAPVKDASGNPLVECVQFVDSYDWGSVATVDVTLGSRKLSNLRVQLVGDAAAGSPPSSCVQGTALQTVEQFGANGLLGIGNFLQDCGPVCEGRAIPAAYYTCIGASCSPVAVPVASQLQNPAALFSSDNNGVVVQLPSVASPGAPSMSGNILFGINTQSNNALGSAQLLGLTSTGTFTTTLNGGSVPSSFIDSGSNGYFFAGGSIPNCPDDADFFCPAASVAETATLTGNSGAARTVGFTVDNADTIFQNDNDAVLPGLAGSNGDFNGTTGFDWGLPFFYVRTVFVLFENQTLNGTVGPALAF